MRESILPVLISCLDTATSAVSRARNALNNKDQEAAFDVLITAHNRIEMMLTSLSLEMNKTPDWRKTARLLDK